MAVKKLVIIMHADERKHEIVAKSDDLKSLQSIVGGYIERISIPHWDMYVNEDAIMLALPVNQEASKMVGQVIRGDVALLLSE